MCTYKEKCDAQKMTDIYNEYEREYFSKWDSREPGHGEDATRTWVFFKMLSDSRLNIRIKDR